MSQRRTKISRLLVGAGIILLFMAIAHAVAGVAITSFAIEKVAIFLVGLALIGAGFITR